MSLRQMALALFLSMCQCLSVMFLWWQQLLLFQDGNAAKEKKKKRHSCGTILSLFKLPEGTRVAGIKVRRWVG